MPNRQEVCARWWKANPRRTKQYKLLTRYGIDHDTWDRMWAAQGERCAICETPFNNKRFVNVDHNERTGAVRALLCSRCNRGMGFFNEDPALLLRVAEYLDNHSKGQDEGGRG